MAVSISVPLAADAPEREIPFMDEELRISDFTPAAKKVLSRIYSGLLDDGATLASGRKVDSTALLFQWIVEQVAADTYVVPAESDVRLNVQYGAGGVEFTGSYAP